MQRTTRFFCTCPKAQDSALTLFGVWGLGFRGLEFRGLGFRGLGFWGLGFRVLGVLGFRV